MITEEQLVDLLQRIRPLLSLLIEQQAALQLVIHERQAENLLIAAPRTWAFLYERPFIDHISIAVLVLGLKDQLAQWASLPSDDLHRVRVRLLEGMEVTTELPSDIGMADVLVITTSLIRNLVAKQHYGLYINDLVFRVREFGDEDAFLKAVRVDRSVLACPTFAFVLSVAELATDQEFLSKVASAIKEPRKSWDLKKGAFRVALQIIRDTGALSWLSQDSAYRVLYLQTGLYQGRNGEPPDARSLWVRIRRWRNRIDTKVREEKSS